MTFNLAKIAAFSALLMLASGSVLGASMEKKGTTPHVKKGTTPYVTHFIFRPVQGLVVPGLGKATLCLGG
jgi:hypothetical protein